MDQHIVKVKSVKYITQDVLEIITERPANYHFIPGQATDIAIARPGWDNHLNPFTFTGLPDNDDLEFIIKVYPAHKGMTNELLKLQTNDELILHDVFGSISYRGEGVFIAGGAGVTPFISILRALNTKQLIRENKLILANKTENEIIMERELKGLLGTNFINILSDEKANGYHSGLITEDFLKAHINLQEVKNIYLCGPPLMMEAVLKQLSNLGIPDAYITTEKE